jgi:hypothetical protein
MKEEEIKMEFMKNGKLAKIVNDVKNAVSRLIQDTRADGYTDVLMKILISVVVGSALLTVMKASMPELFKEMLDKIRSLMVI